MTRTTGTALAAKTRPPQPARGVIPRPRLEQQCELVRSRLLTLVTAPPGYGKTSVGLAWSQALAGDGAHVAWLRLGPEDADAERFLSALAQAVRHACGGSAAVGLPWAPGDLSIPPAQRIDWLLAQIDGEGADVVLFIDNAHELQDGDALPCLSMLLRFAPESLHLVLLGRTELPLALASLRAQDAVLDVQADTLCFDLLETEQLLRRHHGDTAPDQAAQLHAYTGGWIAALRAAMLAARLHGSTPGDALRRGPLKSVQALFSELVERLPPPLQAFLECAAVTQRTCARLAVCLSGHADAGALLDELEKRQLFVTAADEDGWCEFHLLFREFVRRRLHGREPARLAALHRSAAHWFAGEGLWADAIHHALAGDDTPQALDWIEQHAMTVVGAGDLLTLRAWEWQLRAHLVQSPLRLRLAFAWGLSLGMACDRALSLLDGVEADLPPDAGPALREECLALRAVIVMTTGDYELGASLAGRCTLPGRPAPWVANAVRNVVAAAHLHTGHWQHLYGTAALVGGDRVGAAPPGDPMSLGYRLSIRGLAEYRQGQLDEAAQLLEQALAIGVARGPQGKVLAALPAPTLALVRYEQDRLDEAVRINAEYFDVNRRVAPIEGLYGAYLVAARVARLQGHPARARYLLDEGESIGAARGWRRVVAAMRLERLRHCLLDGRLAEAAASVEGLAALAAPGPGRPALECRDFGHATAVGRGWLALAGDQPARAAEPLAEALEQARASGRLLDELMLATSLALAEDALGDTPAAVGRLRAACSRARAIGAMRSLVDQPVAVQPLLAKAMTGCNEPGLVTFIGRASASAAGDGSRGGAASRVQTLSPRELSILKLVADGKSNKAIARGLGIAPETVKSHVSRIFGKLGASNRAQAASMVGLV